MPNWCSRWMRSSLCLLLVVVMALGPAGAARAEFEELAGLKGRHAGKGALRAPTPASLSGWSRNGLGVVGVPSAAARVAAPAVDRTVGDGCTYATIGAAITAAVPGDTLLIEGGRTFTETLTISKTLTLQGGYDGCASGSADRTTIDGNASGSVVTIGTAISVTLQDLNLTNGATVGPGGGILFLAGTGGGSLDLVNVDVRGNRAFQGGGIYVDNVSVHVRGGNTTIRDNVASSLGGGVYAVNSLLWLEDTRVGGAGTAEANQLGPDGRLGAGLYLVATHAVLSNTTVASNTFQSTWGYGGGAYLVSGSYLTLTNGSLIAYHTTPSGGNSRGAGIYVDSSTVTLDNSRVMTNTSDVGGGVRLWNASTLNVRNGSLIRNNASLSGAGGGIAAAGTPDINISDSTLRDNHADTDGGAIYLNSGTLDFTGGWTLRENTAGGNGGAVAVVGTAASSFRAEGYSLVYFNRALGGHGGMAYMTNNETMRLYATVGYQMYVYANRASGNGGALYADNGGFFDVYGQVSFDRNRADNGGAVYLANASRLWLDDYVKIGPELWDNWADDGSGGAIYALNSPRVQCDGATLGRSGMGNHASAGDGGAVYLSGSTFDADNCRFIGNEAATHGGAIAAYTSTLDLRASYGTPVALAAGEPERRDASVSGAPAAPLAPAATACDPTVGPCSVFFGNVADSDENGSGDGGAVYTDNGTFTLRHTELYTNTAYRGGAIYQTGANASAQVENVLIYSNTVGIALGAGIRSNGGTFSVTHTTIANNINGAGYSQSATVGEVNNSIAWGNTAGGFWVTSGTLNSTCTLDQSGNAGPALDPRFVDSADQDFHLIRESPAIDACGTGLSPDLDNVPRPVFTGYDMGAYEYSHDLAFAPDLAEVGYAGQSTLYRHVLTNTGAVRDLYTISGTSSLGWSVSMPPTVTLAAGTSMTVELGVDVPPGTPIGTVDTAVFTVTVAADPTLSAHVVNTTTVVCQPIAGADFIFGPSPAEMNQPVIFTGTVAAGQLPITYTWHLGDGSPEQSGSRITHTFTTSNTFTVWMTATNACPSSDAAMREVKVLAYPDITVTPLTLGAMLRSEETATQTLQLGNTGDADLVWSITEVVAATWLSELPTSGAIAPAGSAGVDVGYNPAGLTAGTYTTTLRIASNDPDAPAVDVPVSLIIPEDSIVYLPLVIRGQ